MGLSPRDVIKGIKHPALAVNWTRNQVLRPFVDRYVTPIRATYLFDHDWDVAVILDGCRYDIAREQISDHPIGLGEPRRVYSAGSISYEWIERTFDRVSDETLSRTAYITANAFSDRVPQEKLGLIDRVWQYGWDADLETVPPRPVTDRAIKTVRSGDYDRYIVHYMQPHLPPVKPTEHDIPGWLPSEGNPGGDGIGDQWRLAKQDGIDPTPVIEAYEQNLRAVLDDLELLLHNVDADDVVVTADHGNYLGENGKWGHPAGQIHKAVRAVPWWETIATDEQTHTPAKYDTTDAVHDRESALRALGYIE